MQTVAQPALLVGAASTAAGHRRNSNQDASACGPAWFAVADGMGGHLAGAVASRVAVESLCDRPPPRTRADLAAVLITVNNSIRDRARIDGTPGMGTTIVGVVPCARGVFVFHVGDSRCYRLDDGVLTLVTRDHSHVQELIDLRQITPEEAQRHRFRNVVTRALGVDAEVQPEIAFISEPVGRLLLCSDGLTDGLCPRTIGRVLLGIDDPKSAADRLVDLALAGDARDNITAVVVDQIGSPA